jgi:uncharacterized protein YndB with AHSA1/START domain
MTEAVSASKSTHEPMIFSQPGEFENQVSRIFRAPPERVFRMFTDPANLPYIFSPKPELVTVEKAEFRKGGRFSIAIKQDDGSTLRLHGEFREFDPPRRVVNTFEADTSPGVVAIETDEFEPVGDFTRLTVRWKHQRKEDRDKMWGPRAEAALTKMWDHFAELLEQAPAEPVGFRA